MQMLLDFHADLKRIATPTRFYEAYDGFIVEIDQIREISPDGKPIKMLACWLFHKDYYIKEFIMCVQKSKYSYEDLLEIIQKELPKYITTYQKNNCVKIYKNNWFN